MESTRKNTKAQVDAANKMVAEANGKEVKQPVTNPVEGPKDGGLLPGERPELNKLHFDRVGPERIKVGAWKFHEWNIGEPLTFMVERIVSEEEAEASPDDAPLFEGVYVKEYPSKRALILKAHFQLVSFLEDEVATGAHERKVYEAVITAERAIKGGRTVYDYEFREALLGA